jgi:hypothetical protein
VIGLSSKKRLSPRQSKFVAEYLKDGNALRSYRAAGYSGTDAALQANSSRMIRVDKVAAAIDSRRASTEITIARKTVADMLELEEHFTAELRGEHYKARIAEMDAEIASKRAKAADLQKHLQDPGLDSGMKAALSAKLLDAAGSILDDLAKLTQALVSGRDQSSKAGITLGKLKGAFDPRRPTVDDPDALIDATLRSIIRSGRDPSDLLRSLSSKARDVQFTTFPVDREPALEDGAIEAARLPPDRASPKGIPELSGS